MRIGIIGSGATGLAAAWKLARAKHQVTIFESHNQVGGLSSGFRVSNWDWSLEKFYHHWFIDDHDVLGLIDEIGHSDKVRFSRPKTSYWIDGQIYRSEISPSALLLPISFLSKIRLGLVGIYLKLTRNWHSLEKKTTHEWLNRYMGQEAYNKLWRPLLIAKFGDYYQNVPMSWLWARLYSRSLKLGTFEGGFQAFWEALAEAITKHGAKIRLNTPIQKIDIQNDKPALSVGSETIVFDIVISTTSPESMLRLMPNLANTPYGKQMATLRSIGAICLVLALKQSLLTDGTYWLNLPAISPDRRTNSFPFLGLVEHTNFVDRTHFGGDHIVYCGDYVPPEHEYFRLSDTELMERFIAALPTVNQSFSSDWVRKHWVFRATYAQPIPELNHSQKIPSLRTSIPNLYWVSMSQVYPWDRGTNYAVQLGRQVAKLVINQ
jgi:protoporphyrinogen oxidase